MLSYNQPALPTGPPSMASDIRPVTMTASAASASAGECRHIWIITGPAGCGKSTVAQHLSHALNVPYVEGDEFHPPANIEKMSSGTPLTDADRWDWLIALRQQAVAKLQQGAPGVVLTCSALKKKYRDVIRIAAYTNHAVRVHFVYLRASEELLIARVRARQGHYMKDDMVRSQFSSLEEPSADEPDCLSVDVTGSMTEVQRLAQAAVEAVLAADRNHPASRGC